MSFMKIIRQKVTVFFPGLHGLDATTPNLSHYPPQAYIDCYNKLNNKRHEANFVGKMIIAIIGINQE